MKSETTRRFWKLYGALPESVQRQAKEAYALFSENPYYPSLHFKRVHSNRPIYSVRINLDYRAIGVIDGEKIIWSWIGSHADYDNLLNQIRR